MKNEILLELADRWMKEVNCDSVEPGGEEVSAVAVRAHMRGVRETKRECADALRMLVQILP